MIPHSPQFMPRHFGTFSLAPSPPLKLPSLRPYSNIHTCKRTDGRTKQSVVVASRPKRKLHLFDWRVIFSDKLVWRREADELGKNIFRYRFVTKVRQKEGFVHPAQGLLSDLLATIVYTIAINPVQVQPQLVCTISPN